MNSKLGSQATRDLVSFLVVAALVIRKGNANASKRVCVCAMDRGQIQQVGTPCYSVDRGHDLEVQQRGRF
jgi:hypothetical protein